MASLHTSHLTLSLHTLYSSCTAPPATVRLLRPKLALAATLHSCCRALEGEDRAS